MSWPFQTLRILYPVLTLLSLITIFLLSAWVSSTNSFSSSFDSYYNQINNKQENSTIKFPAEIYLGFIFSIISFLFTAILCFPTISRKFGYKIFIYLIDVILSIFWFVLSILIVARINNGSIIDPNNITIQLNEKINELQIKEGIPDTNKSLLLGKAITILSWIQFLTWTFTTIILAHIRSRKWTKKDRNKRINIVSGSYDQDAKMLTTPSIIKEIDELVKNPPNAQTTIEETSSKTPVLELNLSLTTNTTLYLLDPVSSPPKNDDELFSIKL
ncbi:hypothetical protein RhiirA1_407729 [Rhizophagus irregularis]|uniref:MARVEL domain-containing protein n=2 Tax=Rhizophagus irregularis TaxID=588596 RepID=U9UMQ0_RHIID|nr:hypothetical protein GLOIN_2v1554651 [Rhizophagus irregularis DAOM 181602=DAOM 197198]PKC75469.1 hypothetical protein RhiirA1_407729 [Rhizophagus irregularis]PKK79951.1 hypothetical protein RhiirC2_725896 [Rhizophagus irregularis]PKY18247.1 hypothetical protein RhiirB3_405304 [Rhizophagus irregularis]POG76650.1 hypothetical protein GLOIN_2v1554651 [Rhizophagus irregularis DAOM 181602=DAOM 197198]UZO24395.1 hypothetical protein OCT59_016697 [Rhizophagus irregularis]|eukprot:XP_025183516.1 hypothetical protein GLOIN_2v1554651 [Rhizophagus irregularis DAOM 181602=DAOM 197198]